MGMDIFEKTNEDSEIVVFNRRGDKNRNKRISVYVYKKAKRLKVKEADFVYKDGVSEEDNHNAPESVKWSCQFGYWKSVIPELTYDMVMEITAIASVYINDTFRE